MKIKIKCPHCNFEGEYKIYNLSNIFICHCGGLVKLDVDVKVKSIERYEKSIIDIEYNRFA